MKKIQILENFLERVRIIEITEPLLSHYVEIDSFSQRTNPNFTSYEFNTPRNMGKNNLTQILQLTLLRELKGQ
jgi:tRNA(fMet)-specific endonuclease VapC